MRELTRRGFLESSVSVLVVRALAKLDAPSGAEPSGIVPFVDEPDVPMDTLYGDGLDGRLLFGPFGGHQRILVNLTANDARFAGPPPVVIRRGAIEGIVLLDPARTSIEGRIQARGVSRGPLSIANVDASDFIFA